MNGIERATEVEVRQQESETSKVNLEEGEAWGSNTRVRQGNYNK